MTDQLNADQVTPDQVFEQMPNYFQPDKAGNTNATINFDLSGANAGKYWIKIADATATSGKGEGENPNLTLMADANDFVKITSVFGIGRRALPEAALRPADRPDRYSCRGAARKLR